MSELKLTREQLLEDIRRHEAEQRAKWPTFASLPEWHPAKALMKKIEADVLAEVAPPADRAGG